MEVKDEVEDMEVKEENKETEKENGDKKNGTQENGSEEKEERKEKDSAPVVPKVQKITSIMFFMSEADLAFVQCLYFLCIKGLFRSINQEFISYFLL